LTNSKTIPEVYTSCGPETLKLLYPPYKCQHDQRKESIMRPYEIEFKTNNRKTLLDEFDLEAMNHIVFF